MDYMSETIKLALENVKQQGRPGAALIVHQGNVIATGVNETLQTKDPTAHAIIVALRKASYMLQAESLKDCTVYTTIEPCAMCLAALYWAEVDQLIFGMTRAEIATYYDLKRRYHKATTLSSQIALSYTARTLPMVLDRRDETVELFKLWKKMHV